MSLESHARELLSLEQEISEIRSEGKLYQKVQRLDKVFDAVMQLSHDSRTDIFLSEHLIREILTIKPESERYILLKILFDMISRKFTRGRKYLIQRVFIDRLEQYLDLRYSKGDTAEISLILNTVFQLEEHDAARSISGHAWPCDLNYYFYKIIHSSNEDEDIVFSSLALDSADDVAYEFDKDKTDKNNCMASVDVYKVLESRPPPSGLHTGSARGAALLKQIYRYFLRGSILFNLPNTMWVGISEVVELRLKVKEILSAEDRSEMERTMFGRGEITEDRIDRVGTRVRARIFADEDFFTVKELSSADQDVNLSGITFWDWQIKPLKSGETTVVLRITLLKDAHAESLQTDLESYRNEVVVKVKSFWSYPIRFWKKYWQWIIGTLIAAIGAVGLFFA